MADEKGYWPIPRDLGTLHDVIIGYAVRIQAVAAAKQEKTAEGPVSHSALFTLHRIGIVTHRSIRSLCETGWTQVSPILIRTLLDLLASCYAIVSKYEDAEFMAFKFMGSDLIKAVRDSNTSDEPDRCGDGRRTGGGDCVCALGARCRIRPKSRTTCLHEGVASRTCCPPSPTSFVCARDMGNRCARTWVTPNRHAGPPPGGDRDAVAGGYSSVVAGGVRATGDASGKQSA